MSGYLLFRRDGSLWGVPSDAVAAVERAAGTRRVLRLRLARAGEIPAEDIVEVVPQLAVRPLPRRLRAGLPPEATGLALHDGVPLVVLDPAAKERSRG